MTFIKVGPAFFNAYCSMYTGKHVTISNETNRTSVFSLLILSLFTILHSRLLRSLQIYGSLTLSSLIAVRVDSSLVNDAHPVLIWRPG